MIVDCDLGEGDCWSKDKQETAALRSRTYTMDRYRGRGRGQVTRLIPFFDLRSSVTVLHSPENFPLVGTEQF